MAARKKSNPRASKSSVKRAKGPTRTARSKSSAVKTPKKKAPVLKMNADHKVAHAASESVKATSRGEAKEIKDGDAISVTLTEAKAAQTSTILSNTEIERAAVKLRKKTVETDSSDAKIASSVETPEEFAPVGIGKKIPVTAKPQNPVRPPATVKANPVKSPSLPAPAEKAERSEKDESSSELKAMKTSSMRHGFKLNEFVVYPAHGVGQIVSVEEQEVAGFRLELFVISFVKDKMTLRVPTSKVAGVGMRKLSDLDAAKRSLEILTGRARIKRTMWSRRAQEYEAKINSGDINAIAEVVRDLYRSEAQPEQSYSERQLYEAALDRMMREIAAVHKLTETETLKLIDTQLKKNVKRAPKSETGEADEAEIEEAA